MHLFATLQLEKSSKCSQIPVQVQHRLGNRSTVGHRGTSGSQFSIFWGGPPSQKVPPGRAPLYVEQGLAPNDGEQ